MALEEREAFGFGEPTLGELAEQQADDLHRRDQLIIAFAGLGAEALEHADDAPLAADGDAEGDVEPRGIGGVASRQANLACDLADPHDVAGRPHRAGDPLAARHPDALTECPKGARFRGRPRADALHLVGPDHRRPSATKGQPR